MTAEATAGSGPSPADRPPSEPATAVSSRHAAVALGGRSLWSDVDLDVAEGSFVAVLGPNGVGKSTLVRALLGLVPLAAGRLVVLGSPPGDARKRIGYLPQRRAFDAGLRVRGVDVVRLGLDGHRWGLPLPGASRFSPRARDAATRVDEVIDLVDASAYAGRPVGELSGGEQQRLLIAQALVRRPELLILDEPLDSLDLPSQATIAALVARISRSEHVTVLMVAHDVNPIVSYLDGVIYLAAGRVVSGAPTDVITGATLSRLYGTPIEVLRSSEGRLVVVGAPDAAATHGATQAANRAR